MKRVFVNKDHKEVRLSVMIICRHEEEAMILVEDFLAKNINVFYDKHWDSAKIRLIEMHLKELPLPDTMIMASVKFKKIKEKISSLFTEFGSAPPPVIVVEDSTEGKLGLMNTDIAATMNSWEFKIPTRVLPKILQVCQLREDLISD